MKSSRAAEPKAPKFSHPTRFGGAPAQRRQAAKICATKCIRVLAVAHLLELLNGTLVDTTALVDQVCDGVSALPMLRAHVLQHLRPVVVDLPESTWPITTTLM